MNFELNPYIQKAGQIAYATFIAPYIQESIKRINYHVFKSMDELHKEN